MLLARAHYLCGSPAGCSGLGRCLSSGVVGGHVLLMDVFLWREHAASLGDVLQCLPVRSLGFGCWGLLLRVFGLDLFWGWHACPCLGLSCLSGRRARGIVLCFLCIGLGECDVGSRIPSAHLIIRQKY